LNWHTGETFSANGDYDDPQCFDLDRASSQPIPCPAEGVIATEGAYTLRQPGLFSQGPVRPLLLLRRHGRTIHLSGCHAGCTWGSLSHGRVMWLEGTTVHGYAIASRRRVTWHLPPPVIIGLGVQLTSLGTEAVVTLADYTSGFTAGVTKPEVYRLRWP